MSETDLTGAELAKRVRELADWCHRRAVRDGVAQSRDAILLRSIAARLEQRTAERDHWKANHDEAVRVKRALLDRPDLAERAKLVQELIRERDEAVARLEKCEEAFANA